MRKSVEDGRRRGQAEERERAEAQAAEERRLAEAAEQELTARKEPRAQHLRQERLREAEVLAAEKAEREAELARIEDELTARRLADERAQLASIAEKQRRGGKAEVAEAERDAAQACELLSKPTTPSPSTPKVSAPPPNESRPITRVEQQATPSAKSVTHLRAIRRLIVALSALALVAAAVFAVVLIRPDPEDGNGGLDETTPGFNPSGAASDAGNTSTTTTSSMTTTSEPSLEAEIGDVCAARGQFSLRRGPW